MTNERFGKVTDGNFTFATEVVQHGGRIYVNPSDDIRFASGEREVVSDKEVRLGVVPFIESFEVEDDVYEKQIDPETQEEIEVLVYRGKIQLHYGYEPLPEPERVVKRYSVSDLFWWVKQNDAKTSRDNSSKIDEMLEDNGMYTVAVTTKEVSDDNMMFGQMLERVKQLCEYDDDEVAEALEYAEIN